jgi:nucleotide-binding universal stress UspA family protein
MSESGLENAGTLEGGNMKIQNVLVPVDFSPPSRLAVNYGVSLARKLRAKLTLMNVVESPAAIAHPWTSHTATIDKEHREQAVRMLTALLGSEDQDDLDLGVVVKSGNIKKEIAAVIREQHADVVVMGTHGRGLFGRWVIGSITEGMLRKIPVPILTVCRAAKPLTFNRILFATDLSECSEQGFDFALQLATAMRSDLVLVHVMDLATLAYCGAEMIEYASQQSIEQAKAKLAEWTAQSSRAKVKIEAVILEGVAAEEILKAADRYDTDLIVLTIRKKGFVEHAILGTTAERVIREANVPVLSIPAIIEGVQGA